jgi:two-component system chemotaxis sensor kinase CheA
VLRLRERLLPLVTLHRLLDFEPALGGGELCIAVMQSGPNKFGLLVDRVLDIEEIVVKPVARALRTIPLYVGATILGDGAVVMILNAKEAASHIGAPDFDAHDEQGDSGLVAGSDASMPMVIARVGADAWKAAPISLVSRIQDVWAAEIVVGGGRAAVQYQGQLMPIVAYGGGPPALREDKAMPVLVFENEGRSLGLVVDEVIDIVDCPLRNVLPPKEEGALGSVIVAGRVADLIDPGFLWLRDLGGQRAPLASAKRALLVDADPFHRSLIELSLTSAGYEIVTVDSEAAATALLALGTRFDVILLDAAQTSASFANAGAPIVNLSDAGGGEAVSRFDRSALMSALAKAMRRDVA